MANLFKKLFGKKDNESKTTTLDNMVNGGHSDSVTFLNKCIRDAFLKGEARLIEEEIRKNQKLIEKSFPDEPKLFERVCFIVDMVNALISENVLTEDGITRLKKDASNVHINEQTIDFIISEKKKCPETYKYHVPLANELDRYDLEFKILPLMVDSYNEALQNGGVAPGKEDIFTNISFWQHIAKKMDYTRADFDWNEISFNKLQIGGKQCVSITFPKPLKSPHAKYGLVVIDKKASYFTLEKAAAPHDNLWYLCGAQDHKHVNYGPVEGLLTEPEFVEIVLKRCFG